MISLITPTYNRQDSLQVTIKSIQAQTFTDWELIIIDDGSTDNTEQVMQTFLTDNRIRYFKKENTGQAHSLNVGVSHAKREFVAFLDSDDEAYPNWLEEVVKNLNADTGIACIGSVKKYPDGRIEQAPLFKKSFYGENLMVKFTCGSLFIRREIFNAVGGYDINLKSSIQTDLSLRLLHYIKEKNLKVESIDKNLVQINIHDGPRIRNNWPKVIEGTKQFLDKHYDYMLKNEKKTISDFYGVLAFAYYKLKNRQQSLYFLMKSIKYNPLSLKNYLKIIKYTIV